MRPLLRLALCLLLVSACSGGGTPAATTTPTPTPTSSIPGVVLVQGLSHKHVTTPVTYATHPPMGGPHWPPQAFGAYGWQACAVYSEPVVDQFAVHSLEHGAVWLTYQPPVSNAALARLKALDGIRPDYVMISPYPGQGAPVVATAWGAQLRLARATDPRLVEFVREYAGGAQGGEPGADCAHGSTIAQAKAAKAAAG